MIFIPRMFTYKQFFEHLLTEMYYGKTHTEEDLPDNRPFGFMVYPDGTFGICHTLMSHDDLVGGISNVNKIINLGGIKMVIRGDPSAGDEFYIGECQMGNVKEKAKSIALKLAEHYNLQLKLVGFSYMSYY